MHDNSPAQFGTNSNSWPVWVGLCSSFHDRASLSFGLRPHPHWKQHTRHDAQLNKMEPNPNCVAQHVVCTGLLPQQDLRLLTCFASRVASSVDGASLFSTKDGLPKTFHSLLATWPDPELTRISLRGQVTGEDHCSHLNVGDFPEISNFWVFVRVLEWIWICFVVWMGPKWQIRLATHSGVGNTRQ